MDLDRPNTTVPVFLSKRDYILCDVAEVELRVFMAPAVILNLTSVL